MEFYMSFKETINGLNGFLKNRETACQPYKVLQTFKYRDLNNFLVKNVS